jgi:hypothetical protein
MLLSTFQRLYRAPAMAPLRPAARALFHSGGVQRLLRSRALPLHWRHSLRAFRILTFEYGHLRSVSSGMPVDREGRPIPWYTYPAIEFIRQLDFGDRVVFEYGAGNSTLFWAGIARRVVSVEDDPEWHVRMLSRVPRNVELLLETDLRAFAEAVTRFDERFDVIVIDGAARQRTRLRCAGAALSRLKAGGVIILDNADWLPESSRLLRDAGLLEVDMTGFAPINGYVSTTSFFFDRAFGVRPKADRHPAPGVGARPFNWEKGAMAEWLAAERLATERAREA